MASTIEGEVPGYSKRGLGAGRLVNARSECFPSYICGQDGPSWCCRGVVIRRGQVTLGGHGNRIARVERARYCSRRKPRDRSFRPYPHSSRNVGGSAIANDGGCAQNPETAG